MGISIVVMNGIEPTSEISILVLVLSFLDTAHLQGLSEPEQTFPGGVYDNNSQSITLLHKRLLYLRY